MCGNQCEARRACLPELRRDIFESNAALGQRARQPAGNGRLLETNGAGSIVLCPKRFRQIFCEIVIVLTGHLSVQWAMTEGPCCICLEFALHGDCEHVAFAEALRIRGTVRLVRLDENAGADLGGPKLRALGRWPAAEYFKHRNRTNHMVLDACAFVCAMAGERA